MLRGEQRVHMSCDHIISYARSGVTVSLCANLGLGLRHRLQFRVRLLRLPPHQEQMAAFIEYALHVARGTPMPTGAPTTAEY